MAEIKDLLDTRIRPAVAQDGGDILFNRFDAESGAVFLHMRGACAGCPSSAATLKAGVENHVEALRARGDARSSRRSEPSLRQRAGVIALALDTALNACAACLCDEGGVLASARETMERGHQERLAPMTAEVMSAAGLPFDALDRIGVVIGPGSFTGLRVGLAFAKGLSLALDISCVGVGTLEALAAGEPGLVAAAIAARPGQVFAQAFLEGRAIMTPASMAVEDAAERINGVADGRPLLLTGPGAVLLAPLLPNAHTAPRDTVDIARLSRLVTAAPAPSGRPEPLYLRPPDARTLAERALAERAAAS